MRSILEKDLGILARCIVYCEAMSFPDHPGAHRIYSVWELSPAPRETMEGNGRDSLAVEPNGAKEDRHKAVTSARGSRDQLPAG